MDVSHPREGGKDLILNARSIRFKKKKTGPLALITLSAFLQTRRKNSIPSSRQWIEYVGSASERRMDSHDGADVVHGVSSIQPAIGQSILRRSRECLSSRVLSAISAFFSSSAATWKGAIAVKRLRRDGLINNTYHICIELSPREATRRHFPSIIDSPTRIENYRSENLRFESFFS